MKNPLRILGVVFTVLGAAFLVLGVALGAALPLEEARLVFLGTFGLLGLVFLCVGVGSLAGVARAARRKEELKAHGEAIPAEILGLEVNRSIRINGRCPRRLVCRYEEDGVAYVCRSENLMGYPTIRGNTVTVYRDPYDRRRYYVDVESVMAPTVEL